MSESSSPTSRLHLGVAFYPEHWSEERWPEDIRLMREAGLTVVRMAEFAWSILEPAEGEFHLDWLDRAIDRLAAAGIVTVLGTPTASPPTWLVQQFPDLLAVDEYGQRAQVGNRCHYCVNSPEFHLAVQRIVGAMAKHFGANPNVIGWQLDNEYNRVCYCERCQGLFQQFLANRYGTLDNLNQHWSTVYWSQTYFAWEQIPIPIGPHNPGLMLEFKRFITDSYRRFQRLQLDNLRPCLLPDVWVTHDFMGWHEGYDHYTMSEDLDLVSWNWYTKKDYHDYHLTAAINALTRGFKHKNFWVMEMQPGNVNWFPINNPLEKNEARSMAWHAVAHGADAVLYWQWRSALGGQEQYHGTLVDQSGQARPFYNEVQKLGREFATVSSLIAGSTVKANVALLNDYESRWSIQWQRHHNEFDYVSHFNNYCRPLAALNVPIDVLSARTLTHLDQLRGYRLLIAPTLLLVDDELVKVLQDYVSGGGHLVLTIRSGMKDRYNALLPQRQPGPLAEMAGIEVEDYYALQDPVPVKGNWFEGQSRIWAERLRLLSSSTRIIARYGKANGWLDDQVAISVNSLKNGLVYYVGAYLDETAQQALMTKVLKIARITTISSPPGVEVSKRVRPDNVEIYFFINHKPVEQPIQFPWPVREHLSGFELPSEFKLEPYGVVIVTPISAD